MDSEVDGRCRAFEEYEQYMQDLFRKYQGKISFVKFVDGISK